MKGETVRLRTEGEIIPLPGFRRNINQYGAFTTAPTPLSPIVSQTGSFRMMEDVDMPGFYKKQAAGELIVNPMYSEHRVITSVLKPESVYWKYTPVNSQVVNTGQWTDNPFRFNSLIAAFVNQGYDLLPAFNETDAGIAVASAFSKAASPDAATFVTLGELRATLDLIQAPLDMLIRRTRPIEDLKRRYTWSGRKNELSAQMLDDLTSLWLTIRYGVIPLMYEIEGFLKALQRVESKGVVRQTSRGFHETSHDVSRSLPFIGAQYDKTVDQYISARIKYRAGLIYDWEPDLAALLGARPADIPQALWELVTLSFVAEWAFNIQEYLGALTFAMRAGRAAAWYTAELDGTVSTVFTQGAPKKIVTVDPPMVAQAIEIANASGSKIDESVRRKTRKSVTASNAALGVRIKLNPARLVDGFSLLYQRLSLGKYMRKGT